MADWADWLVTHGQADAQMVAEAERVGRLTDVPASGEGPVSYLATVVVPPGSRGR